MEQHDVAVFQIGWISVLKQPVVCDLMRLFASRSLWQLLASYSAYTLRATTKTTTTETSKRQQRQRQHNNKCDILQVGNKTISGI